MEGWGAQERNGGMWAGKYKMGIARAGGVYKGAHQWFSTLTPALCAGRRARAVSCCPPTLAGTWTRVPSHLCGHQLSESCSAPAAAPGAPSAVFGKDTSLALWGSLG